MKSILISIKPQWVEKIFNREKTVEIRKSKPKCELPCKVYIYETKDKILIGEHFERSKSKENLYFGGKAKYITKKDYYFGKGKVVAEFTLNKVNKFDYEGLKFYEVLEDVLKHSCLTDEELCNYIQDGIGYGWRIDNLIIYDTAKELNEFDRPEIDLTSETTDSAVCPMYAYKKLKRPPQSWCYVLD